VAIYNETNDEFNARLMRGGRKSPLNDRVSPIEPIAMRNGRKGPLIAPSDDFVSPLAPPQIPNPPENTGTTSPATNPIEKQDNPKDPIYTYKKDPVPEQPLANDEVPYFKETPPPEPIKRSEIMKDKQVDDTGWTEATRPKVAYDEGFVPYDFKKMDQKDPYAGDTFYKKGGAAKGKYADKSGRLKLGSGRVSTHTPSKKSSNW
tara:strand:+ start:318 stop:929 length:612 start_codon:yes stop_codon:yes gene_type:complete